MAVAAAAAAAAQSIRLMRELLKVHHQGDPNLQTDKNDGSKDRNAVPHEDARRPCTSELVALAHRVFSILLRQA